MRLVKGGLCLTQADETDVTSSAVWRTRLLAGVFIFLCVCFWFLRVQYWKITTEEPFSDMADYIKVAHNIREHWFFAKSVPLFSYYAPITPSLLALSMLVGGDHFLVCFRFIVQAITFIGTLVLARELSLLTGRKWLGLALLLIVAFCRPSIFWSLKPSTETVSEAFLILSTGLVLYAFRTASSVAAAVSGLSCICLALNRPQFLLGVLLIGVIFLFVNLPLRWRRHTAMHDASAHDFDGEKPKCLKSERWSGWLNHPRRLQALSFALGIMIVWAPWAVRNSLHYGAFVPINTSGADSLIFDFGSVPIRVGRYKSLQIGPDDHVPILGFRAIRDPLYQHFNDYQANQRERQIFLAWLKANWSDYPRLFLWRLKNLIVARGPDGLSKVSREILFPFSMPGWNYSMTGKSWLDLLLVDKTPWIVIFAFAGTISLIVRFGIPGVMMSCLTIVPWFTVALAFRYERAVESMISITVWLAVYGAAELAAFTKISDGRIGNPGST